MKLCGADWFYVVALLLFAAGLRFVGIDFGQPDPEYSQSTYPQQMLHEQTPLHPDEFLFITRPLRMVLTGQLNPQFFENPSFLINLNFVTFFLTDAGNGLTHEARANLSGRSYAPFHLYLIGRTYSALGGLLAVAAAYALTLRTAGRFAAATVGLLVAVSFPLVQHSHYATTSSLAAGFATVALWAGISSLYRQGKSQRYLFLLAGIGAGLAAGNRYNAAVVSLVVFCAGLVLLYRNREHWRTVFSGWLLFPLTFIVTTPHVIFDTQKFLDDVRYISNQYLFGQAGARLVSPETGLLMEYQYLIVFGIGIPAAIMILVGFVDVWWSRSKLLLRQNASLLAMLLILAYLVPYSLVILRTVRPNGADQLLVPAIPAFAILAGSGIGWLYRQWLANRRLLQVIVVVGIIGFPLAASVQLVRQFNQPDTREIVQRWVYQHLPYGSRIYLSGPYNVPLDAADYRVEQGFTYDERSWGGLLSEGFDYVIVSDALLHNNNRFIPDDTASFVTVMGAINLIEIARVERPVWLGYDWALHTASYWHNPGLVIYCLTEQSCAAVE